MGKLYHPLTSSSGGEGMGKLRHLLSSIKRGEGVGGVWVSFVYPGGRVRPREWVSFVICCRRSKEGV